MRTLFGATALVTIAIAMGGNFAYANEVGKREVHGGGKKESSFYSSTVVDTVINGLQENRITGYSWGGVSDGTIDNVDRVNKDPVDLGIGQLDILNGLIRDAAASGEAPGFHVLIENMGPECYYLATNNPGYSNFGHVLGNAFDITIATTGIKSGSFGSLNALAKVYPDLVSVEIKNYPDANAAVEAVANGEANFVFFVQKPTPGSGPFQLIAEKGLTYVPVVDWEMEDLGLQFFELPVTSSEFSLSAWKSGGIKEGQKVATACTSIALFGGDAAKATGRDQKLIEAIAARVPAADAGDFSLPQTTDWLAMIGGMVQLSTDKIGEFANAARDTVEDLRN